MIRCEATLEGHTNKVTSVCYSPDGKTLASGSFDNTIKIWDVASGECIKTLSGHIDDVISICCSPDGTTLASGARDGTIRIWEGISLEEFLSESSSGQSFDEPLSAGDEREGVVVEA